MAISRRYYAEMPERSNGTDSRSVGLVPTGVRILLSAYIFPTAKIDLNKKSFFKK